MGPVWVFEVFVPRTGKWVEVFRDRQPTRRRAVASFRVNFPHVFTLGRQWRATTA